MSSSDVNHYCFAFYNLENLFDTKNDPVTLDDDFTEKSDRRWNEKRFRKKIKKLGSVIQQIGYADIGFPPIIVGVAEVENKYVLEELVNSKFLKEKNYGVVHYDSPDERGIDTGLLYRKEYVEILDSKTHTVHIQNEHGERDYTRDILAVHIAIENHEFYVLVNHWPSRRAGVEKTAPRRMAAAIKNLEVVEAIKAEDEDARFVIMGDFNDDPKSKSIQHITNTNFYNPMELLLTREEGSTNHKGAWNLFDQLLVSHEFMQQHGNRFRFEKAEIFNPEHLTEYEGRRKGNPFRTYLGAYYAGGFSDHFPIYGLFSMKN
ncbi:endonuclease [Rasiella rasia]|uniref:Endonuclease n=1 Tax=Rasiella rasia TaxID=2744027 RepID=A0A6G6GM56_9FLAO|nr:endonuclease/exonuclease/phosphatase family protein [Rasiella rasia]QIE59628.1 endonuclease [Rasiella rasia]